MARLSGVLWFLTFIPTPGDFGQGVDPSIINSIADVYDANRAQFRFGSLEFDHEEGRSESLSEARKGNFSGSHKATGQYVFEGVNAKFSRLFSLKSLAETTRWVDSERGSSTLRSVRLLTNGKLTLVERIGPSKDGSSTIKGHIITPGGENFYRFAECPLDLNVPSQYRDDLAENIRRVLRKDAVATLQEINEHEVLDQTPVVRIVLKLPYGVRTYWVDLERGAIPLLTHDEIVGGDTRDRSYDEIRFIAGRGWLPFSMTTMLKNGQAQRLVVKKASFESPPPRGAFRLDVDRPTTIANVAEGRAYKSDKGFDLNDLPRPNTPNSVPVQVGMKPGSPPGLPGEQDPPRHTFFYLATAAAALLGLYLLWRRFRAASSAASNHLIS